MKTIQIDIDSGTDQKMAEAVTKLHQVTIADNTLTCVVCNEPITASEEVTCHLMCPGGESGYELLECRCTEHATDITEILRAEFDELIVDGYIGRCRYGKTGQSWPVLLVPQLRAFSPASTITAREIDVNPYDEKDLPAVLSNQALTQADREPDTDSEHINYQSVTLFRWDDSENEGTD